MTDQSMLTQLIELAVENGYELPSDFSFNTEIWDQSFESKILYVGMGDLANYYQYISVFDESLETKPYSCIIFDKEFLRALGITRPSIKLGLIESDNRIKYLYEAVRGKKNTN
jgi:hypothetical protein